MMTNFDPYLIEFEDRKKKSYVVTRGCNRAILEEVKRAIIEDRHGRIHSDYRWVDELCDDGSGWERVYIPEKYLIREKVTQKLPFPNHEIGKVLKQLVGDGFLEGPIPYPTVDEDGEREVVSINGKSLFWNGGYWVYEESRRSFWNNRINKKQWHRVYSDVGRMNPRTPFHISFKSEQKKHKKFERRQKAGTLKQYKSGWGGKCYLIVRDGKPFQEYKEFLERVNQEKACPRCKEKFQFRSKRSKEFKAHRTKRCDHLVVKGVMKR